jgi:hypothetical protein
MYKQVWCSARMFNGINICLRRHTEYLYDTHTDTYSDTYTYTYTHKPAIHNAKSGRSSKHKLALPVGEHEAHLHNLANVWHGRVLDLIG